MRTIYDEAKEIIINSITITESSKNNKLKVVKAIEQAQKQEKLLELYRYLNENTNDYDLHFELVDEIHNKIEELEKQIKELENEKI